MSAFDLPEDLDRRVSAATRLMARDFGITAITVSVGRWRPVIRAIESQERALQGDNQLLDERLSAGDASAGEQKLAADLLTGRVKARKRRLSELLAEDRRQLVAEFIKDRAKHGVKRESIVADAVVEFDIATSEVYTSLKKARE